MPELSADQLRPGPVTGPNILPASEAGIDYNFPKFVNAKEAGLEIIDAGYIATEVGDLSTAISPDSQILLGFLSKYINGPLLTDIFINHRVDRKSWEELQPLEAKKPLKENRVSRNPIVYPATVFGYLLDEDPTLSPDLVVTPAQIDEMQRLKDEMLAIKNKQITVKKEPDPNTDSSHSDSDTSSALSDVGKAKLDLSGLEALKASELLLVMENGNYDQENFYAKKLIGSKNRVMNLNKIWKKVKAGRASDQDIEILGGQDFVVYLYELYKLNYRDNDPDSRDLGYDSLSNEEKLSLVQRYTNLSVQILRQNGFTVEKRPFNQPDLS